MKGLWTFFFAGETMKLADLVDLDWYIEKDDQREEAELQRRDAGLQPATLAVWLEERRKASDEGDIAPPGEKAARAHAGVTKILVGLGLLSGVCTASYVLASPGSARVNVAHFFWVLVLAQLVFLVFWVLASLSDRPGFDVFAFLNPWRFWRALGGLLPQEHRESLSNFVGVGRRQDKIYFRVHKWALLGWSQWFAVAFNLGALFISLVLLSFSDILFAWESTVWSPEAMHRLTSFFAIPFGWLWPEATVSVSLIEGSRFDPISGLSGGDPSTFRAWWPFLIASLVTYGLIFRSTGLGFAMWRFTKVVDTTCERLPGITKLRHRMTGPRVEFRSTRPQPESPIAAPDMSEAVVLPCLGPAYVINWSETPLPVEEEPVGGLLGEQFGCPIDGVLPAGGLATCEDDDQVVQKLAGAAGDVFVVVKAWESPIGDFTDFLKKLRQGMGEGRMVYIVPVGPNLDPPPPEQVGTWDRGVRKMGDPWLKLKQLPGANG